MRRESSSPRLRWRERCEEAGFSYHSVDGTYWDESACYAFSSDQVDRLEAVTEEVHSMCLAAAETVVRERRFAEFAIPEPFHDLVAESWIAREPSLFGRFDFSWDGRGEPRLLEYNADTPTALLEASVVQWQWLEDTNPQADQFNSLHEKLVDQFRVLAAAGMTRTHFACVQDNDEDIGNTEYLRDCALQAGMDALPLFIEDLGWDAGKRRFIDLEGHSVGALFKLYPWEWLVRETFGAHLLERPCRMLEPAWKMLLSNKALMVVLWELYSGHPNLLPTHFSPAGLGAEHVRKPLLSREGANVSVSRGAGALLGTPAEPGPYGAEGYVYQGYAPLPDFGGRYPVVGAWVVGDRAAGMGIREDDTPITRNTSRFVPHYFD